MRAAVRGTKTFRAASVSRREAVDRAGASCLAPLLRCGAACLLLCRVGPSVPGVIIAFGLDGVEARDRKKMVVSPSRMNRIMSTPIKTENERRHVPFANVLALTARRRTSPRETLTEVVCESAGRVPWRVRRLPAPLSRCVPGYGVCSFPAHLSTRAGCGGGGRVLVPVTPRLTQHRATARRRRLGAIARPAMWAAMCWSTMRNVPGGTG